MLRIAQRRILRVGGELRAPLENARGAWDHREGLLLLLRDEDGRIGQGEASPLPGFSTETLDECWDALHTIDRFELDLDAPLPAQVSAAIAAVAPLAARFALETALLDLCGQALGRSLAELLGAREGSTVQLAALIAGEGSAPLALAQAAVARGIGTLKLKVGAPPASPRRDDEILLLRALRGRFGDGIAIRLDANGSLPPDDARARLRAFAEFGPEYVEEPLADVTALPPSPVPIALDESMARPWEEIAPVLADRRASVVVLKPMRLGGALACLAIARHAHALGADAVVSHLWDGPVALAAAVALALALPSPRAAGLDPHRGLSVWPRADLPFFGGGVLRAVPRPGLGIAPLLPWR